MKKIVWFLFISFLTYLNAHDVHIVSTENKDGKITPQTIEKEFVKAGFYISDNRDMNRPFMIQFKKTDFDTYNLFTLYHVESVHKLAKKYPRIGLFSPMSMSIYTRKGDDRIHVAFLDISVVSKVTGIPLENRDLQSINKLARETLSKALPNSVYDKISYNPVATPKSLITKMHVRITNQDWSKDVDSVIEKFESRLELRGFIQAGYTDINYDFIKSGDDSYDLFASESICKLPVIYSVAKTRPEAGAFAPCSVLFYKKKNDPILHIEYPNVYNWISSLNIKDPHAIEELLDAQGKMEIILYKMKTEYESY